MTGVVLYQPVEQVDELQLIEVVGAVVSAAAVTWIC
jgi:hypothetical protein